MKKIRRKFFTQTFFLTSISLVVYIIFYSEPSMGGWYMMLVPIPILIIIFLNYQLVMMGIKIRSKTGFGLILVYAVPIMALMYFAFKTEFLILFAGLLLALFNRAVMLSINELNSIPPTTLPESEKL